MLQSKLFNSESVKSKSEASFLNSTSSNLACALKIDFKIDSKGITRIIDIGDGLSAGLEGFDRTEHIIAKQLRHMHLATGATLYPVFGELISHAMHLEIAELPIHLREIKPGHSFVDGSDWKNVVSGRLLPICFNARIASYVAY